MYSIGQDYSLLVAHRHGLCGAMGNDKWLRKYSPNLHVMTNILFKFSANI